MPIRCRNPLLLSLLLALALPLATIATTGCAGATVSKDTGVDGKTRIVIYGSGKCGICTNFRAQLDRRQRSYEWHDILLSNDDRMAMIKLVQAARPGGGGFRYPVVKYGARTLVSPTWPQFKALLDAADRT